MRAAAPVFAACLLWALPAAAQEDLTDADYNLDLVQTPVLGSGRIVGLGGAYTAIAEGIDGAPFNPAAYGSRTLWELDWWEWEITASILFPGILEDNDFFNSGNEGDLGYDSFYWTTFGFRLQFGDIGFGAIPRVQVFTLDDTRISLWTLNQGVAFQLLEGQVVLGVGARIADLTVEVPGGDPLEMTSTGPEIGILVRLEDQPWRLGAAARSEVRQDPNATSREPDPMGTEPPITLPQELIMPWEVQVGFAVQIGNRPLNERWVDPWIEDDAIEHSVTMDRWQRERQQVWREMGATTEPPPPADPYVWLPRRAQDPGFWDEEEQRREREEEQLEERWDAAEDRRDERVKELPRTYALISADLIVTGATPNAVGVEGMLQQRRITSGDEVTYSVRLGIEGEPWGGRLKLRAGSYLEPSRFDQGYRLHGTGGFDLRLFTWDLFGLFDDFDLRVGATIDVADRYFDWGIGVGFWH